MRLKLSWLLSPSKFASGAEIANALTEDLANADVLTAPSPEKPLSETSGPRSGRTSTGSAFGSSGAPDDTAGAISRKAGEISNATLSKNFALGALKAWEGASSGAAAAGTVLKTVMMSSNVKNHVTTCFAFIMFSPQNMNGLNWSYCHSNDQSWTVLG